MLRAVCVWSFSMCVATSSVSDADQALPAINVKFDFPSSSTSVLARDQMAMANRDSMFATRVQQMQSKTQQLADVLEGFAKESRHNLHAVMSIIHQSGSKVEPVRAQPFFLQNVEREQSAAGMRMSDIDSIAEDAESASKIYIAAAQSLPSAKDQQQSVWAGNVEALGGINVKLVHEKHQRDSSSGTAHCAACERDHDQICPDGWSEVATGHCSGPSEYDGPCMAFAELSGLSVAAKLEFERACLVCWPCRSPA